MSNIKPSKYQSAILEATKQNSDNIIIQACAGSGKTTTLQMICEVLPRHLSTLAVCFNKVIADDFARKLPSHIEAKTLHGLGLSIIGKTFHHKTQIDNKKIYKIVDDYFNTNSMKRECATYSTDLWKIKTCIPAICSLVLATQTDPTNVDDVDYVANECGLPVEDDALQHIAPIITLCRDNTDVISFDDMIDFPLFYKMSPRTSYDVVLVDECQDLNQQQIEFVKLLVGKRGRLIAVGDVRQAIYGFRGAHAGAMEELKSYFKCKELPLSVCYRCGTNIVREAQLTVGEDIIQPYDDAETGTVIKREAHEIDDTLNELTPGDMVVCRTNAPLVSPCLELIAKHKKAMIRGKSIGVGLVNIINAITKKNSRVLINQFNTALDEWETAERARLTAKNCYGAIQRNVDRVETLKVLSKNVSSFKELENIITTIFADDSAGVVFSTIHKAKGLEAGTIVFLGPETIPHWMALKSKSAKIIAQEYNLEYVAKTRARCRLIYQKLPPQIRRY